MKKENDVEEPVESGDFKDDLTKAILASLRSGPRDFQRVLSKCYGADPSIVYKTLVSLCEDTLIFKEGDEYSIAETRSSSQWLSARSIVIQKLHSVSPANPKLSQWWFNAETCDKLVRRIADYCIKEPPAFLGTPFLALFYSLATSKPCTVLDVDEKILSEIGYDANVSVIHYNAESPIPDKLLGKHAVVAIDPPWYPEFFDVFLCRARLLARKGSLLFCVIPGTLTRSDVMIERNKLVSKLLSVNSSILSIDNSFVSYLVPDFETKAYERLPGFDSRSWRKADLVVAKLDSDIPVEDNRKCSLGMSPFKAYAKSRYRIFTSSDSTKSTPLPRQFKLTEDLNFAKSVSRRVGNPSLVNVWTSTKSGFVCTDLVSLDAILEAWEQSDSKDIACILLLEKGISQKRVDYVDKRLKLWPSQALRGPLRDTKELSRIYSSSINATLACQTSVRKHKVEPDGYRADFSRDRDRIIWSRSFKRLVGKTQVFPLEHDEQNRSRATHTMEVRQLAHTISESFGLDGRLTEAVALAHDIGHPPFGHAGEDELNSLLNRLCDRICGFNHYEHGVDTLCWFEDAYLSHSAGGFPGLNLTAQVYEGVFKHCYFFEKGRNAQKVLYAKSKYQEYFKNDYCHLEGQAVRAADKISYLVEDIEDALRAQVIGLEDLMDCSLFHRSSIDVHKPDDESELVRFVSQRGAILSVLMTDLLEESNGRLSKVSTDSDFRNATDYCISNSKEISQEMKEIWQKVQTRKIHGNIRVQQANARAAYVVGEILVFYILNPHLVDPDFARIFSRLKTTDYYDHYRKCVKGDKVITESHFFDRYRELLARSKEFESKGNVIVIPLEHIIQANAYVASMTDTMALKTYRENIQGLIST